MDTEKFNKCMSENDMLEEKSWEEFRETGLFMLVNTFLQIFGWSLTVYYDKDPETGEKRDYKVFPVRTKYRGFPTESYEKAYKKISKFMRENAEELEKEANM